MTDQSGRHKATIVRADILAAQIYRELMAAAATTGHSGTNVWQPQGQRNLAALACNSAAEFMREIGRRDPLTCQMLPHHEGLPVDDSEVQS